MIDEGVIIKGPYTDSDVEKHLIERIDDYLSAGGLVNPELMEHDKVQHLLLDIRDFIRMKKAPRSFIDSL